MLAEERYARTLDILRERGFAKVEELAESLGVSAMTVRRDLQRCQASGMLQRCHGGAVLGLGNQQESSFDNKSNVHKEEKGWIAKLCAGFVSEGMSVFLDAGTTCHEIARRLADVPRLTVVSNDLRIMGSLLGSEAELIMLGGGVQKLTGSVIGPPAPQMLENMRLDIAFIGVNAIDENMEAMTPTIEKVYYKRQAMRSAARSYLVADRSKFNRSALHRIGGLGEFTGVVTDRPFGDGEKELIAAKKIKILLADSGGT